MQDTLFLSLARKVVYISSIAIFGTIASIVMYATFAAFTGPSSGPSATNHSRGLLYDYMFGAATNSGAVQQGTNWNSVPSSGTSALAGTVNEKLNFVVSKLLTGISTAALDGVYDSTAVAANKNGNALNMLKYLIQGQDAGAASPASSGCENMDVYRSWNNYYVCVAWVWKTLIWVQGYDPTGNFIPADQLKNTIGRSGYAKNQNMIATTYLGRTSIVDVSQYNLLWLPENLGYTYSNIICSASSNTAPTKAICEVFLFNQDYPTAFSDSKSVARGTTWWVSFKWQ